MKKRFTRILAALALLVFMAPSLVAWGQTYSRTTTISIGDVVILVCESKTAEMGAVASYGASVAYTTNPAGVNPLTIEAGSAENTYAFKTSDNKYLSWTTGNSLNLSDTKNANSSWSVSFNNNNVLINNASDNTRKLRYNGSSPRFACYTSDQTAIQLYKATAAAVAAPTFSPANGATFEESLQVTLSQADNKDIYYNINSESDPDANSTPYTGPISISATSTIKAIAIDGENTSSVATATYTKLTFTNIENIIAAGNYAVKGTVVAVATKGFVVGDGTGYIYVYLNNTPSVNVNDKVTVSGAVTLYANGKIFEFTGTPTIGTAQSSNYVVEAPTEYTGVEIEEYIGSNHLSDYVQYEGVFTNSGYSIALEGTEVVGKISYPTSGYTSQMQALDGKMVRVQGYFTGTNQSGAYFYTMLGSIEEVVSSDPTILVTNTLTDFTYVVNNGPSAAQSITVSGSNLTDNIALSLGESSNFEMSLAQDGEYSNTLSVTPTEGTVEATAVYVRMKAGLAVGSSYTGSIAVSSDGATPVNVSLSGSVTEPEPENVTWDLTTNSYASASTTEVQWTSQFVNMTLVKGTSSTNANNFLGGNGNEHTRFYKDQVLSIAPVQGFAISSIVITGVSGHVAGFTGNAWTNATATASSNIITITPNNGDNPCSVAFSVACYATQVLVYYKQSTATFYAINIDDDIENGMIVATPAEATEGTTVTLTVNPANGYYLEDDNIEVSGTSTIELTKAATGVYTFEMPAEDVSVYAIFSEYTGTYYTLVNSTEELVSGKHYIIASSKINGTAYAMGEQNGDFRNQVETAVVGEMIYATEGMHEIVLTGDATCWTMFDGITPGYLYAVSGNKLKTRTDNSVNANGNWIISFNEGAASIVSQIEGDGISNTIKYNLGSSRFSCYTPTSTMAPIYLYKKANETDVTFLKDVKGYGSNEGGYVLVASPVSTNPEAAGMITDTEGANATPETAIYDLYYFDQSATDGKEWINYRQVGFNTIEPGKGYLYANKNDVTLTFTGTAYDGEGEISLDYVSGENIDFPGLNLIGNPFNEEAGLDLPFYRMNTANGELVAVSEGSVQPMEGVFVYTTTMTDPETGDQIVVPAHFTAGIGSSTGNDKLIMNLSRQGNTIDRAIVRFDEGSMLPKFQLNPNNTKIYVNEGNKDYAIVRSAAEAEMPVSFRASENGTYTLAVEAENVEMNYLHLIDNLNGMDVDLLQTPRYTFEAKTSDYASRFRLVFKANGTNENNAETFAYFNGTNWTVSNVGEATLQVVDVTGRTVANQMINGNAELNLNQPAGVYVIRLVNGDNVKTQKVVVR